MSYLIHTKTTPKSGFELEDYCLTRLKPATVWPLSQVRPRLEPDFTV